MCISEQPILYVYQIAMYGLLRAAKPVLNTCGLPDDLLLTIQLNFNQ